MTTIPYKLIIFDLDGTLSKSKTPMDAEMANLLARLLQIKKVAVISGCAWHQFETQFLSGFSSASVNFSNLYLLPTSGTRLYTWKGDWHQEYKEDFSQKQKEKILISLSEAMKAAGYKAPEKIYGQIIEDRASQITFSGLGQNAPIELKMAWDPDRKIRECIIGLLSKKIPEFDIRIGGTTSIDITLRGVNKAYGILKLETFLNVTNADILFIGDSLFPGGNDYPARTTGVDCKAITGPKDVKNIIRGWLSE